MKTNLTIKHKHYYRILISGIMLLASILAQAQTRHGALDLTNEVEHRLEVPSVGFFERSPFTIEMWVKLKSNGDDEMTFFDLHSG